MPNYIHDFSEFCNSLQDAYTSIYSEAKKLHTHPNRHFTPSEKKSIENIARMNRGDYSVPPGSSKSKKSTEKEVKHESPRAKKRRTNMSDVQVR